VKYKPGTLKAVGTMADGRKIEGQVTTTGKAQKIVLTPYRKTITGDGKDGTVFNVTVLDALGREVPDAMNLVHFDVKGNARLIGVGNGDPSSHEPDLCADGQWQRRLFNGKCQVILQGKDGDGAIELTASGDGLQGATSVITAINP
jgi:beta-galactosidase